MSLIPEASLAAMRSTLNRTFVDTATIQRKSVVNQGGEETETWADLATAVPCRIAPIGGGETGVTGGRVAEQTTHTVTFTAEQDVTERDRIVVSGVTYNVTLVRKRGSWELSRRVEVVEA